jgi:hypothetical protein
MKIDSASFRNFGPVEKLEIKFHDTVTRLVGRNGSGKTTVGLKGLMACINGIAESSSGGRLPGERFRFVGKNGKSADVEYGFVDESTGQKFWIKNHITEASNKITFRGEGDAPVNEEWLKGFLNTALMSAKAFTALSGIDQARAIGIDTSSFDAELKALKTECTDLGRDLRAFRELVEPEKVESIDVAALIARKKETAARLNALYFENRKKNEALRANHEKIVEAARGNLESINAEQARRKRNIDEAREALFTLQRLGYDGAEVSDFIGAMPFPEPEKKTFETPELVLIEEIPDDSELRALDDGIAAADQINRKASLYNEYFTKLEKKLAKEKEIADNRGKQTECEKTRADYISQHSFAFAGLGTDADGNLLLNERPLNSSYFSAGELELIVAKLHAAQNPVFKVRFIDDFDLLDDANQEKILYELLAAGFQVITAEVGERSDKENVIILRECKTVSDEEQKPTLI